jgi:hypothetical protein
MLRWFFAILGLGVFAAGVLAIILVALLLGPILVWLSWNVLDLGPAVGAGELGFWGIVLFAIFLAIGFGGRVFFAAMVFLIDPGWFHSAASIHWPEATFRNFVAVCLLLLVASASAHPPGGPRHRRRAPAPPPTPYDVVDV